MTISTDDLVLKSKHGMRGKRCPVTKGGRVEAHVYLDNRSYDYDHPFVVLKVVRSWKDAGESTEYDSTLLTIKYQRNRKIGEFDKAVSGWMRGAAPVAGRSYAGEIYGQVDGFARMEAGMRILDRAREAVRENDAVRRTLSKRNDDLLTMIAGLIKVGVIVVVKDGKRNQIRRQEYSLAA